MKRELTTDDLTHILINHYGHGNIQVRIKDGMVIVTDSFRYCKMCGAPESDSKKTHCSECHLSIDG